MIAWCYSDDSEPSTQADAENTNMQNDAEDIVSTTERLARKKKGKKARQKQKKQQLRQQEAEAAKVDEARGDANMMPKDNSKKNDKKKNKKSNAVTQGVIVESDESEDERLLHPAFPPRWSRPAYPPGWSRAHDRMRAQDRLHDRDMDVMEYMQDMAMFSMLYGPVGFYVAMRMMTELGLLRR